MKARNADLASSVLAFVRMNPFNDNGEAATSFFSIGAAQQSVLETHRRAFCYSKESLKLLGYRVE